MSTFKFPVAACAALLVLAVTIAPLTAMAQCVTPPSGMVHWWPADGNTFDIIGGEHGTLQGDADFGPGRVVEAFSLDGNGDYVQVPNDPAAAFNFDGSFTIDAWIFLESNPPEFAPIVTKWDDIPLGDDRRSYFFSVQNTGGGPRLRFDVSKDGLFLGGHSSIVISSAILPLNTWTHVAAVFDSSTPTLRMYINGALAPTAVSVIEPSVTSAVVVDVPVLIGASDAGSNVRDFFDGSIDEVELFDRALTGTEIDSIFDAGASGKTIPIVIDIKPGNGDDPDPINLGSKGKTPVAVLSTETFDATTMDIGSILFAGAPVNVKNNGTFHASFEDVNDDGLLDLVLHFNTQDLDDLTDSSTEATLTGTTDTGRCVSATDSIKIVPSN